MEEKIKDLEKEFKKQLETATEMERLEKIKNDFLGRK